MLTLVAKGVIAPFRPGPGHRQQADEMRNLKETGKVLLSVNRTKKVRAELNKHRRKQWPILMRREDPA